MNEVLASLQRLADGDADGGAVDPGEGEAQVLHPPGREHGLHRGTAQQRQVSAAAAVAAAVAAVVAVAAAVAAVLLLLLFL